MINDGVAVDLVAEVESVIRGLDKTLLCPHGGGFPVLAVAKARRESHVTETNATDGCCHNAQIGSFNHECGKPATWIGRKENGYECGFCDWCKENGHESPPFKSWRRVCVPA